MYQAEDSTTSTPDVLESLQELFLPDLIDAGGPRTAGLIQGLNNLASMPVFDLQGNSPAPVPGQGHVTRGLAGFRRQSRGMTLALACGTAPVRYLPLDKFIALIEKMHDPNSANIVIQTPQKGEREGEGRPQVLARLNPRHSAIHIIQGVLGKVITKPSDIISSDIYYIDRKVLASFYLAAKTQISAEDQLEEMIAAYDGFKGYSISLDPLNPFDQ